LALQTDQLAIEGLRDAQFWWAVADGRCDRRHVVDVRDVRFVLGVEVL
jgi:hypothetical protein